MSRVFVEEAERAVRPAAPRSFGGGDALVADCRSVQRRWSALSVRERLRVLRQARRALASRASGVAALIERRPIAETLASEMLPLLEAAAFLEREAGSILAARRHRRSRSPIWLRGTEVAVEREPYGVVLIVAPSNYPLMLPGIQALQALAAGNAVIVKPAPSGRAVMDALAATFASAGLPAGLFRVARESIREIEHLCRAGVDKVVFTGSAAAGREVAALLHDKLTPATLELSGNDAAFVRHDADLDDAVATLAFATVLNGGATCIAPRRVFVARELEAELLRRLALALAPMDAVPLDAATAAFAADLVDDAVTQGARVACGGLEAGAGGGARLKPTVLANVQPGMRINRVELFAPLLAVTAVRDDDESLRFASVSPYALGATVFGRDVDAARRLARRIEAGVVAINDAIVPTADPRVPLAPRGDSGLGVTRGAEGLLAMTRPKAIVASHGRRPHLAGSPSAAVLGAYIEAAYGDGGVSRLKAAARLVRRAAGSVRRGSREGVQP